MARKTLRATKAISDSVSAAGVGDIPDNSISYVAGGSRSGALTPRQAYENNATFRKAVTVAAANEAKANLRFFSKPSGNEITDSPASNFFARPNRYESGYQFVENMAKWYKTTGEIAILPLINKQMISAGQTPDAMKLLNPAYLHAYPVGVRSLDLVEYWLYNDGRAVNGVDTILKIPADLLIFRKNWNPYSELRGLSEAVTLINEISTNFYIQRYNISRFKNGVQGDLCVIFPNGTKKKHAQDFCDRWQEAHSIHNDNGFKISAIIGDKTKIEPLGLTQPKDGEFLDLTSMNAETIASLVGVPPSVMGFSFSKARFDTIDSELESWAENSLMPDLRFYSEIYQEIVDRYFSSSIGTTKSKSKLSKRMSQELVKARMSAPLDSNIVVCFDPDSLPILARLNQQKVDQAQKLMATFKLSPNEAAEYVGIDIPYNPIRDNIWVASNESMQSEDVPDTSETDDLNAQIEALHKELQEPKKSTPEQKEQIERLKAYYRDFRSTALEAMSKKEWFAKEEMLSKAKEFGPEFILQFHKDFLALREIYKQGGDIAKAKSYFNSVSKPSRLKEFVIVGGV